MIPFDLDQTLPINIAGECLAVGERGRHCQPLFCARGQEIEMESHSASPNVIDVRSLIPAQRHAKIFELVGGLKPGTAFVLVNDHDPKPLYYQLEAEYPKQFSWTYLERGPEVWRVEIGKQAA